MQGKHVLVTGASGALGTAVVAPFVAAGATVVGTTLETAPPGATNPSWLQVDLGSAAAARTALGTVQPDIVVHCAGGFRFAKLEETQDADFEFLLAANFRAGFHLLRELLPGMRARGFGRIVVVGALGATHAAAGMGVYAATKAALHALVQAAAAETQDVDVTVNAVLPAF